MGQDSIDTRDLPQLACTQEASQFNNTNLDTLLLLNIRIHDLPMVNHHSPATGPAVIRPSELLCEAGIGIRQEELLISIRHSYPCDLRNGNETYHVFLHPVSLSPSTHDERIIGSHDSHNVDSLALDFGKTLQITREMLNRASGRECSRNRKKDDLFIGPFFGGVVGGRDAA